MRVLLILLPLALVFAGCVREEMSSQGEATNTTACPEGQHRVDGESGPSSDANQHGTPGVGGCVANGTANSSDG